MSINSNQFRDLSITSGQDVTVDKSRNYANLFTIKNFDLKELNLTIQYLATINQDQVGLLTNEPIRDAVLGSKNKLEKLNLRLLKNYYSKDWKNKIKFGMRILYSIISILAVDLVQLYSMEQLSDEIKIKSSFMFGVFLLSGLYVILMNTINEITRFLFSKNLIKNLVCLGILIILIICRINLLIMGTNLKMEQTRNLTWKNVL
ncbi:hypothetical protein BpHYR1_001579 [Brachionus plicatilis]|uniref:Uncharacterized protein n=1 Tax=Brachionus plicatilis TaxID=10195 RepID=A0A3M7QJW0_BRAPC|nr:hypothetical protein BpHYR1_001579 [Brachionus plicatilis]